jgi:hypothetical protein
MNWLVFGVAAWLVMGLEVGLKVRLTFMPGGIPLAPSFALVLMVWIALAAAPAQALWGAVIIGLLVDLSSQSASEAGGMVTLVGPMALAYLAASRFVLGSRWVMLRRNPVALALMTLGAGLLVTIVSAVPLTIHKIYGDPIAWSAWPHILGGFGSAFYSAILAVPMAFVLNPALGAFGVEPARPTGPRRF